MKNYNFGLIILFGILLSMSMVFAAGIDCNLTVPNIVNTGSVINVTYNTSGQPFNNVTVAIQQLEAQPVSYLRILMMFK